MNGSSVALAVFCIFVLSSVTNVESGGGMGAGGKDWASTIQSMIKNATAAFKAGGPEAKEAWSNMIKQGKQAMSKMDKQNKQNMQTFLDNIGTSSKGGMKKLQDFDFTKMMKGDGGNKIGDAIKKGIAKLGDMFGKKN